MFIFRAYTLRANHIIFPELESSYWPHDASSKLYEQTVFFSGYFMCRALSWNLQTFYYILIIYRFSFNGTINSNRK